MLARLCRDRRQRGNAWQSWDASCIHELTPYSLGRWSLRLTQFCYFEPKHCGHLVSLSEVLLRILVSSCEHLSSCWYFLVPFFHTSKIDAGHAEDPQFLQEFFIFAEQSGSPLREELSESAFHYLNRS